MKKAQILEMVDIFSDLEQEHLDLIYRLCKEESYLKGQIIFEENTPSQEIFIILDGEVDIQVNADSQNAGADSQSYQKITTLERGQSFGEIALVDQGLRSATARCSSENCKLLVIDRNEFMDLLKDNLEIGFTVMSNLAADLCLKFRRTTFLVRETLLYSKQR